MKKLLLVLVSLLTLQINISLKAMDTARNAANSLSKQLLSEEIVTGNLSALAKNQLVQNFTIPTLMWLTNYSVDKTPGKAIGFVTKKMAGLPKDFNFYLSPVMTALGLCQTAEAIGSYTIGGQKLFNEKALFYIKFAQYLVGLGFIAGSLYRIKNAQLNQENKRAQEVLDLLISGNSLDQLGNVGKGVLEKLAPLVLERIEQSRALTQQLEAIKQGAQQALARS